MTISTEHNTVTPAALIAFFTLTFAITWGLIGSYVLWPEAMRTRFGEIDATHPFFLLATWAPAIAAFVVVAVWGGVDGLKGFLSRMLIWRCPVSWWIFVLVVIPLVYMAGSLIKGGPLLAPLPSQGIGPVISLLFMMLFLGPVEEFGWRGVAQPLLQRHLAPFWAGALIGIAWGIWHLPAFYLAGMVFAEWYFIPFFVGNVVLAILVTPLFNATGGSIVIPMLFHWQLINPFWPDAQPFDTWILFAIAIVVVGWNRETMFSRKGAVTDVFISRTGAQPC